ncbi:hypothetical protein CEXT_21971 [Caerostris extrusa]|uniref:Uncharacterized protein n=1 Tax=Caerostris extrusa TaxID=172846 RepID=A0AAV4MKL2_CAEEX|nr:hypothetical protein CEXT_21971 [Caerostris extrusa]
MTLEVDKLFKDNDDSESNIIRTERDLSSFGEQLPDLDSNRKNNDREGLELISQNQTNNDGKISFGGNSNFKPKNIDVNLDINIPGGSKIGVDVGNEDKKFDINIPGGSEIGVDAGNEDKKFDIDIPGGSKIGVDIGNEDKKLDINIGSKNNINANISTGSKTSPSNKDVKTTTASGVLTFDLKTSESDGTYLLTPKPNSNSNSEIDVEYENVGDNPILFPTVPYPSTPDYSWKVSTSARDATTSKRRGEDGETTSVPIDAENKVPGGTVSFEGSTLFPLHHFPLLSLKLLMNPFQKTPRKISRVAVQIFKDLQAAFHIHKNLQAANIRQLG